MVGSGPFVDSLAVGLEEFGHDVAVVNAESLAGRADLVVHVPTVPEGPTDLVNMTTEAWVAACEEPLDEAVAVARAAHPLLVDRLGADQPDALGRLVWIVPTTALSGAAGFVATGSACEGIRALAKGAAKQWGVDIVATTVVAVAPEAFFPDGTGPRGEGSLTPPALGRTGDPASDLAPLLDLLTDPRGSFTTGGTIVADGGTWMAP